MISLRRSSIPCLLAAVAALASGCWTLPKTAFRSDHPECKSSRKITATETQYGWAMQGCGHADEYLVTCFGYCRFNAFSDARRQASFETGCDESQIEIQVLDRQTLGLRGCGQRLVYKSTATGWFMNTESSEGPEST